MSVVRSTCSPGLFQAAVAEAAHWLRRGEVVALPTETVYGLAANALNTDAVERIFSVKGRPAHNPLIVHVASLEMARTCASRWPEQADRLANAFWPGPLTLVLQKSSIIPEIVTAGGSTVGIRWPSHPVIRAVIEACGFPLAAPSANLSGAISPTTAEHVARSLGGQIPLIVDGGTSTVGIESTVLDLSVTPPRVLRPGIIHAESLAAVLGTELAEGQQPGEPLRSPGMLLKHYAPKAQVLVWESDDAARLSAELDQRRVPTDRVHILSRSVGLSGCNRGQVCVMPSAPQSYAQALYAELHRCDAADAKLIVIESVPEGAEWKAIADRIARAAA